MTTTTRAGAPKKAPANSEAGPYQQPRAHLDYLNSPTPPTRCQLR